MNQLVGSDDSGPIAPASKAASIGHDDPVARPDNVAQPGATPGFQVGVTSPDATRAAHGQFSRGLKLLLKPFTAQELTTRVRSVLERRPVE